MSNPFPQSLLSCPELDGQGPWILSIVLKFSESWHLDPEDLFQDCLVHYLKTRGSYDPAKGARTTFTARVINHFILTKIRTKSRAEKRLRSRPLTNLTPVYSDPNTIDPEIAEDIEKIYEISFAEPKKPRGSSKTTWLRNRLNALGWDQERIDTSFETIRGDICDELTYTVVAEATE